MRRTFLPSDLDMRRRTAQDEWTRGFYSVAESERVYRGVTRKKKTRRMK